VAVIRHGNFYGGDLNWNRIVPGAVRSVARGERPMIRSGGQNVRDYFNVEDDAAAYMPLAGQLHDHPSCAAKPSIFRMKPKPRWSVWCAAGLIRCNRIWNRGAKRSVERDPPTVPERRARAPDAAVRVAGRAAHANRPPAGPRARKKL
jgi:hypothetical protein